MYHKLRRVITFGSFTLYRIIILPDNSHPFYA
jgi:hypothetical protein